MTLDDIVGVASQLSQTENGPETRVRNIHILRALVASRAVDLLPDLSSSRFRTMFPGDGAALDPVDQKIFLLTPRSRDLLSGIESENPIGDLVKKLISDITDGEMQVVLMLAKMKALRLEVGGESLVLDWAPYTPETFTILDSETGKIRHVETNLHASLSVEAEKYGLPTWPQD